MVGNAGGHVQAFFSGQGSRFISQHNFAGIFDLQGAVHSGIAPNLELHASRYGEDCAFRNRHLLTGQGAPAFAQLHIAFSNGDIAIGFDHEHTVIRQVVEGFFCISGSDHVVALSSDVGTASHSQLANHITSQLVAVQRQGDIVAQSNGIGEFHIRMHLNEVALLSRFNSFRKLQEVINSTSRTGNSSFHNDQDIVFIGLKANLDNIINVQDICQFLVTIDRDVTELGSYILLFKVNGHPFGEGTIADLSVLVETKHVIIAILELSIGNSDFFNSRTKAGPASDGAAIDDHIAIAIASIEVYAVNTTGNDAVFQRYITIVGIAVAKTIVTGELTTFNEDVATSNYASITAGADIQVLDGHIGTTDTQLTRDVNEIIAFGIGLANNGDWSDCLVNSQAASVIASIDEYLIARLSCLHCFGNSGIIGHIAFAIGHRGRLGNAGQSGIESLILCVERIGVGVHQLAVGIDLGSIGDVAERGSHMPLGIPGTGRTTGHNHVHRRAAGDGERKYGAIITVGCTLGGGSYQRIAAVQFHSERFVSVNIVQINTETLAILLAFAAGSEAIGGVGHVSLGSGPDDLIIHIDDQVGLIPLVVPQGIAADRTGSKAIGSGIIDGDDGAIHSTVVVGGCGINFDSSLVRNFLSSDEFASFNSQVGGRAALVVNQHGLTSTVERTIVELNFLGAVGPDVVMIGTRLIEGTTIEDLRIAVQERLTSDGTIVVLYGINVLETIVVRIGIHQVQAIEYQLRTMERGFLVLQVDSGIDAVCSFNGQSFVAETIQRVGAISNDGDGFATLNSSDGFGKSLVVALHIAFSIGDGNSGQENGVDTIAIVNHIAFVCSHNIQTFTGSQLGTGIQLDGAANINSISDGHGVAYVDCVTCNPSIEVHNRGIAGKLHVVASTGHGYVAVLTIGISHVGTVNGHVFHNKVGGVNVEHPDNRCAFCHLDGTILDGSHSGDLGTDLEA